MSARQPRDVVLRCGVCQYQAGPTTPNQAARSFRIHSCDLWLERAARVARVAARKAASGPVRDCVHTEVHHDHGTRLGYIRDRCRCRDCRDANAAYQASIDRLKAYGRWDPLTDAEPVRAHVRHLMASGMGWQRVARLSGVSTGAMTKILYGKLMPDGRRRPPTKRVRHETAQRLLAVRPDLDLLGAKAVIDGTGTRRRLQALVAAGWSQLKLAQNLGMTGANLGRVINHGDQVHAATARAVRELYDQLWDVAPPEVEHRDKIAASRARSLAVRKGWMPALAWDDDSIDDPAAWANETAEAVVVDEVALERFIAGDIDWRALTVPERIEAGTRMQREGISRNEIHERCHVNQQQMTAALVAAATARDLADAS